jgi:LysM repeat protein
MVKTLSSLLVVLMVPALASAQQMDGPYSSEMTSISLSDVELTARITYEVAPGDTLGAIAAQYRVSVADIRRWNRMSNDRINVGQSLVIYTPGGSSSGGERVRSTYTVRSGDMGSSIARRNGVSTADLQRWNRNVNLDRLRIGQELVIYIEDSSTGSTGSPQRGRLRSGVLLENGTGFRVRNPSRAYGTPSTVSFIRNGIARVTARFVEVPDLVVHDLSFQRGGSMRPHASHQNGLDADITYYRFGVEDVCSWEDATPENIDPRLNWYLFRTWMEQGVVEYIFVNFELQGPIYDYALSRGVPEDELNDLFEYPERGSRGVIRHEPGHDDHFHIRFRNVE